MRVRIQDDIYVAFKTPVPCGISRNKHLIEILQFFTVGKHIANRIQCLSLSFIINYLTGLFIPASVQKSPKSAATLLPLRIHPAHCIFGAICAEHTDQHFIHPIPHPAAGGKQKRHTATHFYLARTAEAACFSLYRFMAEPYPAHYIFISPFTDILLHLEFGRMNDRIRKASQNE